VGKLATELTKENGVYERLVGFTMPDGTLPAEGAQVVLDGKPAGRVTSARVSERVGGVIGLAYVKPDRADDGADIAIMVDGTLHNGRVTLAPFYDPEGEKLRS
jgi:dimethylglycine dehydrogenase